MIFPMIIILTVVEKVISRFEPRSIHMIKVEMRLVEISFYLKTFNFSAKSRIIKCFTDGALCRPLIMNHLEYISATSQIIQIIHAAIFITTQSASASQKMMIV